MDTRTYESLGLHRSMSDEGGGAQVINGRSNREIQGALATPGGAFQLRLDPRGLGSGRHRVQLLVTTIDGQATLSSPSTLLVDGEPPTIKVARVQGGYGVSVRIHDPYTGIDAHAVTVSFGDGHSARGRTRFRHRYVRGGVYQIVVHVRDKLGIAATSSWRPPALRGHAERSEESAFPCSLSASALRVLPF